MNVFVGFYFILILIEKNVLKISKTFLDTTPLKIFFFCQKKKLTTFESAAAGKNQSSFSRANGLLKKALPDHCQCG